MTELPATMTKMKDWNRISRLASQPRDWRLVWWGMNCELMVMMLTQAGARLNLHLKASHKPFMIIPNCGVNTIRQTLSKLFTFNKYFFPTKLLISVLILDICWCVLLSAWWWYISDDLILVTHTEWIAQSSSRSPAQASLLSIDLILKLKTIRKYEIICSRLIIKN